VTETQRRSRNPGLDEQLLATKLEIERIARREGLDFFDVVFEVVDYSEMNMVAAYGGFPTRYPHWRFGMVYDQYSKTSSYGLSKIYELVINNDPTFAYLLRSNAPVEHKLVMAHVYGHADFFKNNLYFSLTHRKAIDIFANHGTRVRRYIDLHGLDRVETFIDRCLSIENLIDVHSPYIVRRPRKAQEEAPVPQEIRRLRSKDYMETYVNPPEEIDRRRRRAEESQSAAEKVPSKPTQDVLAFLIEHAPLPSWQRDVLGIIRDEAYYFAPQMMTKIMNEGWASYWHSRIMATLAAADASEIVDYADVHSQTMATAPGQLNPYKLGLELFRDIEDRWNRGRHGPEWESCDDLDVRRDWDTGEMSGRSKIFEVRQIYNDVQFIDAFLTEDFCRRQNLFGFGFNQQSGRFEVETRDFDSIKATLVRQHANRGNPIIKVVDSNHDNRGELLLRHGHDGVDLKVDWARETLRNLRELWGRPVALMTIVDEQPKLIRCEGAGFEEQNLDSI
jgi:stage V sporulation protein R